VFFVVDLNEIFEKRPHSVFKFVVVDFKYVNKLLVYK
jgi:hypothetical protein